MQRNAKHVIAGGWGQPQEISGGLSHVFFWTQMGSLIQLIHWKCGENWRRLETNPNYPNSPKFNEESIYRKPIYRSEQLKRAKVSYISSPFTPSPTPQPGLRQARRWVRNWKDVLPAIPMQLGQWLARGGSYKMDPMGVQCGCDWNMNISVGFYGMLMR